VRFATATHRFDGEHWSSTGTTRVRHQDLWLPAEFPASLPIDQIAEAWADYTAAVGNVNRRTWAPEDERRETAAQSEVEREEALRRQRHTSGLLPED